MDSFVVIIFGALLSGGLAAGAIVYLRKFSAQNTSGTAELEAAITSRKTMLSDLKEVISELASAADLKRIGKNARELRDTLKTERGRVTITEAELETLESRLRELDELERELEASALETREELRIMHEKQAELKKRNDSLKNQLRTSDEEIKMLMSELTMSAEAAERVQVIKGALAETESKAEEMLAQIESQTELYFEMKQRYDALDIEYAQLYEKFSASEEAAK